MQLFKIVKMAKRAVTILLKPETWQKKRTWVAALLLLRMAYIFMNEYGLNPFKKSLKGDHVFLTGAGSGIGRGMAVQFGLLGCKLSLSDVNMEGLKETQAQCEKAGIKSADITIFLCDVSRRQSITEGAAHAKATFGDVTILVNNAGIVSGVTTLDLTD